MLEVKKEVKLQTAIKSPAIDKNSSKWLMHPFIFLLLDSQISADTRDSRACFGLEINLTIAIE